MKAVRLSIGLMFAVVLGSCGGGSAGGADDAGAVMPDVIGRQLDIALSDITDAGFDDDVDVDGGGTFGVVVESNWTVCAQSPAPGQPLDAPKLTVDRECEAAADASSPPVDTEAPAPTEVPTADTEAPVVTDASPAETGAPAPTEAPADPPAITEPVAPADDTLTADNSPELAAILVEGDYCSDSIEAFAATYRGRTIEFDGYIATFALHGDYDTRWDFLIAAGDPPTAVGPAFQFLDVGRWDLHLTDESIPGLNQGDKLLIVAEIDDYNPDSCLFFLEPVAIGVR